MTKQEIIEKIVKQSGLKKREINYVIDNFLSCILECVNNNEKIEIRGFGTFHKALRKERKVFSPIAGKHIDLPAKAVLSFKASKNSIKNG